MERNLNYLQAIKKNAETINDTSAPDPERSVKLEDIYIPLELKEIYRGAAPTLEKERVIEADGIVKNYQHLAIVGAPGAGKTTLLKYLALQCCEGKEDYIPVPVALRELSATDTDLRSYIDTVLKKYDFPGARKSIEKNLESGRYILLLDGFDELADRDSQVKTTKEIVEFIAVYPAGKIVLTSRIAGYRDDLPGFTRLEIMGLDNPRIKRFMDKRFGPSGSSKADALLRMVMSDDSMEALAKNPLMLSIIVSFYDEEREEPLKRVDLFRRVLDAMLGEWDSHKGIKNRFAPEIKKLVLRKVAFHNHCRNRRTITEKDILEEIARHVSRVELAGEGRERLLEEIYQRSGILGKLLPGTYDFCHFSLQEYFTGLELNEEPGTVGTVIPRLSESWWEGPILFCAGLSDDASPLIKRIQEDFREDIFYTRLLLCGKCIAEARSIDPLLKDDIVRELWGLYNSGEYRLLRENAMAVLSRIKPRRIIDELLNQLTEPELYSQRTAAEMLGLMGSAEVIPALIMILVKEKESKIRGHAAVALGRIGGTEAEQPLIHALESDEEGGVRTSAAEALGLIGKKLYDMGREDQKEQRSPGFFPALVKALTMDKDERVRGGAAEALGKIGTPGFLPQLIQVFGMERKSSVRWRIALALGKSGGMDEHVREVLIKALHTDISREVRESAAEALGFIGRAECIPALTRALTSDTEADVRGSAAYALGFMQSKEALPVLIQVLITDANGEVRGRAAYALGRLKKLEAIPYLAAVFNAHQDSLIRGNIAYALGQIGGEQAIPFLVQALSFDRDSYVRCRAAEVLGGIGNALTIQSLRIALRDEGSYYGWKVKDKAYESLEKLSRQFHMRILEDYPPPEFVRE